MPTVLKVVAVGDGCSGMTGIIGLFATSQLSTGFVPTVYEQYAAQVVLEDQTVELGLYDTAGAENHDRLRPISYPGADVVLICFSVSSLSSFERVETKWIEEIRYHLHDVPVILVGAMTDTRPLNDDPEGKQQFVTTTMGQKMGQQIKARAYLECSALKNQGIKEVFEEAARVALSHKKKKKTSCLMQ